MEAKVLGIRVLVHDHISNLIMELHRPRFLVILRSVLFSCTKIRSGSCMIQEKTGWPLSKSALFSMFQDLMFVLSTPRDKYIRKGRISLNQSYLTLKWSQGR